MADIKLDIEERVPVVVVEEVKPLRTRAPITAAVKTLQDKTPSNWVILPRETGGITAYNNVSRESFAGSIVEFNAALRA